MRDFNERGRGYWGGTDVEGKESELGGEDVKRKRRIKVPFRRE